jgi:hypothetical protein
VSAAVAKSDIPADPKKDSSSEATSTSSDLASQYTARSAAAAGMHDQAGTSADRQATVQVGPDATVPRVSASGKAQGGSGSNAPVPQLPNTPKDGLGVSDSVTSERSLHQVQELVDETASSPLSSQSQLTTVATIVAQHQPVGGEAKEVQKLTGSDDDDAMDLLPSSMRRSHEADEPGLAAAPALPGVASQQKEWPENSEATREGDKTIVPREAAAATAEPQARASEGGMWRENELFEGLQLAEEEDESPHVPVRGSLAEAMAGHT